MGSDNTTYTAPYQPLTPTNRGGSLLVVDIFCLGVSLLSVVLRIYISNREVKNGFTLYPDDLFCFASLICLIINASLIWAGVVKGSGEFIDLISSQNLIHIQQLRYAAEIFYIMSLFCSRASILYLLQRIQGLGSNILWRSSLTLLSSWAITCIFMIALKCHLSQPWIEYNVQCTGLLARWQVIEISGIVCEVSLFALAAYLVWIVRMKLSSKLKIVLLFTTRALVIVFSAFRIHFLPSSIHSPNPTYAGVPAAIFAIAEAHSSLVTATTPLLKSFIIKFSYIGAKPVVVINKSLLFSPFNTARREANELAGNNSNALTDETKPSATSSRQNDKKRVGESSFSEYESWMPRNGSQNINPDQTFTSDIDGLDSVLDKDHTNVASSLNTTNGGKSNSEV